MLLLEPEEAERTTSLANGHFKVSWIDFAASKLEPPHMTQNHDRPARESSYPPLDEATRAAFNRQLANIVSLLHAGRLTEGQERELVRTLEAQSIAIERLHRFPLSNADEPAFVLSPADKIL